MTNIHRSIIIPLVALLNLVLMQFDIKLGEQYLNELTESLVSILSLIGVGYGIWRNNKDPQPKEITRAVKKNEEYLTEIANEIAPDLSKLKEIKNENRI